MNYDKKKLLIYSLIVVTCISYVTHIYTFFLGLSTGRIWLSIYSIFLCIFVTHCIIKVIRHPKDK